MINGGGLTKSIESTIAERHGRIYGSVLEIKTILEDYRSSKAGGVTSGIMLWEVAVIPSLTNNSETWTNLEKQQVDRMEDLQNMLLRILFNTAKQHQRHCYTGTQVCSQLSTRLNKTKLLLI